MRDGMPEKEFLEYFSKNSEDVKKIIKMKEEEHGTTFSVYLGNLFDEPPKETEKHFVFVPDWDAMGRLLLVQPPLRDLVRLCKVEDRLPNINPGALTALK